MLEVVRESLAGRRPNRGSGGGPRGSRALPRASTECRGPGTDRERARGPGEVAMRRLALAAVLALSVPTAAGCATYSSYKLVEPREHLIAGAYTVQPRLEWSSFARGQVETWTIDGVALEQLRFFRGIAEGQSLLDGGEAADRRPRFLPSLTRPEVVEFVADSLFS